MHRTLDPAVEVFQHASERYPTSQRLVIGLGMALYSRGNYDDAVKALLRGADLNPSDARCYYFLSKAYDSSPAQAEEVIERFRRFAELEPRNARALYYYAMSMWKGRRTQDPDLDLHKIESLLRSSIVLDSTIPEAHLQLGNLLSDQTRSSEAVPEYVRARELNPDFTDVSSASDKPTYAPETSNMVRSRCRSIRKSESSTSRIWTNNAPKFASSSTPKKKARRPGSRRKLLRPASKLDLNSAASYFRHATSTLP